MAVVVPLWAAMFAGGTAAAAAVLALSPCRSPARPAAPVSFVRVGSSSVARRAQAPKSFNERRWRGQADGSAAVGSTAIGAVNDDGGTGGRVAPRSRGSNSC